MALGCPKQVSVRQGEGRERERHNDSTCFNTALKESKNCFSLSRNVITPQRGAMEGLALAWYVLSFFSFVLFYLYMYMN